jgi:hypothetical protein
MKNLICTEVNTVSGGTQQEATCNCRCYDKRDKAEYKPGETTEDVCSHSCANYEIWECSYPEATFTATGLTPVGKYCLNNTCT